jgi:hypothetical protein
MEMAAVEGDKRWIAEAEGRALDPYNEDIACSAPGEVGAKEGTLDSAAELAGLARDLCEAARSRRMPRIGRE